MTAQWLLKAHHDQDQSQAAPWNDADCSLCNGYYRMVSKEFIDPPEGSGCLGFCVAMDETIRQSDPVLKNVI
jgi:hypothetical protein